MVNTTLFMVRLPHPAFMTMNPPDMLASFSE